MTPHSLFQRGEYTLDWVKDFYTQAAIWWGPDAQEPSVHPARADLVDRLCGPGAKRILDLGAGPGKSAAAMADRGHHVVMVELNPTDAVYARELVNVPRKGPLSFYEGDWFTVEVEGKFDVVCCWEAFGLGDDANQRRLLQRISRDWLARDGSVLMDVYDPAGPAHDTGKEVRLPPLKGVPGSVEMIERCYFDPVHSRWIDEWQPVAAPEKALAQSVRCYTPADFLLLLEGTGLALARIEVGGEPVDFASNRIMTSWPLPNNYSYLAQLIAAE
jgi:SAM-dependent methyltransferase